VPYSKLWGQFYADLKIVEVGNGPTGLFAKSLAFAAENHTNGFVPHFIANTFGSKGEIEKLCQSGLWQQVYAGDVVTLLRGDPKKPPVDVVVEKDGYVIPNYLKHNLSAEEFHRRFIDPAQAGGIKSGEVRRRKEEEKRTPEHTDEADASSKRLNREEKVNTTPRPETAPRQDVKGATSNGHAEISGPNQLVPASANDEPHPF
jgi:hypothetical protein